MKKTLSLLMAGVMACSVLAGCSSQGEAANTSAAQQPQTEKTAETTKTPETTKEGESRSVKCNDNLCRRGRQRKELPECGEGMGSSQREYGKRCLRNL